MDREERLDVDVKDASSRSSSSNGERTSRNLSASSPIRAEPPRTIGPGKVSLLLFGSGLCALVYQIAWMREFRLVFGTSTAATAAVLAIFVGGLGAGGLLLGPRADRRHGPLLFYAQLETFIALSAAATPALLWIVRSIYVRLGGSVVLGMAGGTAVRLLLTLLVLALPTLLMGGTLPAAARSVETEQDARRARVALLYGANTLGAVAGCLAANFFLLETFGTRRTLWLASLINLLVAMLARQIARRRSPIAAPASDSMPLAAPATDSVALAILPTAPPALGPGAAVAAGSLGHHGADRDLDTPVPAAGPAARAPAAAAFVLPASGAVGFAFFLMEIVWYRMLGPLLGGTIFTFGLILAFALLGIGLGGLLYALSWSDRPATLRGFAATCLLEAVFVALPYALGDRVALFALMLRPLGQVSFVGYVLGWSAVCSLVVLPPALVAGFQFPLLIALLGRGRTEVGRQVGLAYAWNTGGAILASLAGGFGLLPLLSAPGCWRLVALLLALLGALAIILSWRREAARLRLVLPMATGALALAMLAAEGPTAVWRHSAIGIGRVNPQEIATPNRLREWMNRQRRTIHWEAEGVESSVALKDSSAVSFVLNGKVDGNSVADAATQVMGGLLGAILHPRPRSAMVIGLGTGSTAGWLGAVPAIEGVDVVELEPAILRVARDCAPVNRDVLGNPKVRVMIGDAREVLLTSPRTYDIIFSEPSNPYRAGIASLFTVEYYRAVADRLRERGLFLQWVQGYEVDSRTVRTIYATLGSVFPSIESWQLRQSDLLLIGSREPIDYDVSWLRSRILEEPYRSALASAWRVNDLEGVLSHYVAGPAISRLAAEAEGNAVNGDDRNVVEFGFARSMGREVRFDVNDVIAAARAAAADRPATRGGAVDWVRVVEQQLAIDLAEGLRPSAPMGFPDGAAHRYAAARHYAAAELRPALIEWLSQPREPSAPTELALASECFAETADERALGYIARLAEWQPAEAASALARLRLRQDRVREAADALEAAFERYRRDPWPMFAVMLRALDLASEIAARDPVQGRRLFPLVNAPFCERALNEERAQVAVTLSRRLRDRALGLAAVVPLEPHVPWELDHLAWRRECYAAAHDGRERRAIDDLLEFMSLRPERFTDGFRAPGG